ncbi:MAG: hypothetical protein AAFX93_03855 [Verrucomicrobiota bacterium]
MPTSRHTRKRIQNRIDRRHSEFVEQLNLGEFTGRFGLRWIGPNDFMYHPDAADPLTFHRKDAAGNVIESVTLGAMTTDGASIPRLIWPIPGFSPWDYGPAHLLHDWEFEAHHRGLNNKSFEDVNLTFAEAMWTLMTNGYLDSEKPKADPEAVYTIYAFVNSAFGRNIWDG